ncbi:MAG TPA: hypothetical protein VH165_18810 [Kofleriaceae bacterium]|nr:hypothetical protein [Kofleriaceae bacterium]
MTAASPDRSRPPPDRSKRVASKVAGAMCHDLPGLPPHDLPGLPAMKHEAFDEIEARMALAGLPPALDQVAARCEGFGV